jgi:phosphoglycolate phosphatase
MFQNFSFGTSSTDTFYIMSYNGSMRFKCVIFDLDGTLANTLGDIAAAVNHALETRGFNAPGLEAYAKMVGNGLWLLARDALPPSARDAATVDAVCRDAGDYYREHPTDHAALYPGIAELIAELRGRSDRRSRIKLAVLSNKPDPLTHTVIGNLFPPYTFDLVYGEKPAFKRKPDPASTWELITELDTNPRETLFVGDSEIDLATARAAECSFLGAAWGFRGKQALQAAGAARVIDHPGELLELLALRY